MPSYKFVTNLHPTLGVEIELNLVDSQTMALRSAATEILDELPSILQGAVKPELFQCYIEINTNVCQSVADADRDLAEKVKAVAAIAGRHGVQLFWSGTHPFSPWQAQDVTPEERYLDIIALLQETARRIITFGLHVHVGVDSGDKAIMICDRILQHLPTLLALSANSPFWQGRNTGLHSQRSKIMETLPTAGLPPLMRNWSEYVWLLNLLIETGFIKTIRELWWDVRPHQNFGTVEVRICDMPPSLEHVLGITALIQCLVHDLSQEIDQGTYQFDCSPLPDPPEQVASRARLRNGRPPGRPRQTHKGRSGSAYVVHGLVDRLFDRAREASTLPVLPRASARDGRPTDRIRDAAPGLPRN